MVETGHDSRTVAALLERIVDAPRNLIVLDTARPDELVEQLRQLARRSGQALYLWQPGVGLRSLREGDMPVQVGARLGDSLQFIRRSMHFGVYLLHIDEVRPSPRSLALLSEISRLRDGPSRRVVLFGSNPAVPENLLAAGLRLSLSGSDQTRPRLRDGRWIR